MVRDFYNFFSFCSTPCLHGSLIEDHREEILAVPHETHAFQHRFFRDNCFIVCGKESQGTGKRTTKHCNSRKGCETWLLGMNCIPKIPILGPDYSHTSRDSTPNRGRRK